MSDSNRSTQLQKVASLEILGIAFVCIILGREQIPKMLIRWQGCAG